MRELRWKSMGKDTRASTPSGCADEKKALAEIIPGGDPIQGVRMARAGSSLPGAQAEPAASHPGWA